MFRLNSNSFGETLRNMSIWMDNILTDEKVDITKDKSLKLEFGYPGSKKEDINVTTEDNILIIEVTGKNEDNRRYNIHDDYDINEVKASMVDGLLTIEIPIKKSKSNKINVKVT